MKSISKSPVQFTLSLPQEISNPPSLHHLLTVIVESYLPESERDATAIAAPGYRNSHQHPRICGAWVEVLYELPCLASANSLLSRAVTALATAVLTSVCISRQSISGPYLLAIRSLRKTLENGVGSAQELIPAVMCLILVEVCSIHSALINCC